MRTLRASSDSPVPRQPSQSTSFPGEPSTPNTTQPHFTTPLAPASSSDAAASSAQDGTGTASIPTRAEEEQIRKERAVAELLNLLVDYSPVIPDAVTDYYLARSGFECDDVRIKRLLALAAQKFVTDIATDALQFCKLRQQSLQSRSAASMGSGAAGSGVGKNIREKKLCLTMEDLAPALAEYGVSIKKPEYYL